MKIVWLKPAITALDHEYNYIASQNPAVAKRVFDRITGSVKRLENFPESGRIGNIANTRELVVPSLPYIIIYRINGGRVEILRVFHTSRNWPDLLQ